MENKSNKDTDCHNYRRVPLTLTDTPMVSFKRSDLLLVADTSFLPFDIVGLVQTPLSQAQ